MDILRAGVWQPNQIAFVRPTSFGRVILIVLSLLRWFFLHEQCNVIFNYICSITLYTCVVMIGIFIAIECFLSIVSFVASLDLFSLVRNCRKTLTILSESFLVIVLIIFSVANAVWLFLQVRGLWIQHMLILIQILHAVPSFLLLSQSLLQGLYLYASCGTRERPTCEKAKHLQSQLDLNYMLLVYNITTNVAIAYYGPSVFRLPSLGYMAGDVAYRLYSVFRLRYLVAYRALSIYRLRRLVAYGGQRLRHLRQPSEIPTEDSEPFPPAVQEKRHDSTKESFCSGKNKQLPLLDVLCRWIPSRA